VLVVPELHPDSGTSPQGVSGVEGLAENSVGEGAEGDRKVEELVESTGPLRR